MLSIENKVRQVPVGDRGAVPDGVLTATEPVLLKGLVAHWPVVAAGGMSIGHKGMIFASKALALTMVDLFESPELVQKVKDEFKERRGEAEYQAILPEGPPPLQQAADEAKR